jgi:hypothetical protein
MTMNNTTERINSDVTEAARALEAKLDAALADSFPASDPVAITVSTPHSDRGPRWTGWLGLRP